MTVPVPGPPPAVQAVPRALALLDELDVRPVEEHVEVFDAVHRLLQDALRGVDEA